LFGNTTQQQNKPSLFGATQQTQPQQNTMFGATQNTGAQPAQGAIQIKTADNIKGTTRFHELHPDFQSEIQKLDDIFQGHMSNAQRIRESLPRQGELVATLPPDVTYIEQFMSTVELGIDNDSGNIARLKEFIEKDIEEARLCYRAVTNQSLPAQFRYGNAANLSASTISQPTTSADDDDPTKPVDLVPYFSKRADSLSDTLELYQRHIREIEAHLRTMEAGTIERAQQLAGQRSGMRDQRRELAEALNAIEAAIMEAAVKVGKTRDMVTQQTMGRAGAGVL
jgi:nucleoporin p58/p45